MKQKFLDSTTYTLSWFNKRNEEEGLQLKPPFQRNAVWTNKQNAFLIDTILRGYPVPELYLQSFTDESGADTHIVVDGQQRIRACLAFINGEFALSPKDSPEWADSYFDDLTPQQKRDVFGYKFVVRTLPEMPEEEIRKMFARLNRNTVALNNQELRHATYWGAFISAMEKVADDERWGHIAIFTPNDVRRMLDIEYVSELSIAFLHGPQNKKGKLDDFYAIYEETFPDKRRVSTIFNVVLGELLEVLPDIENYRWSQKSDFYTLFLVMADAKEYLPLAADSREFLGKRLRRFAEQVDNYLRDPTQSKKIAAQVKSYAIAVEKAASDLGQRRSRHHEIRKLIQPVLPKVNKRK